MVPGQVITQETIDFMRKLDVKETTATAEGLKLVRAGAPSARSRRRNVA
jgi:arginine decarboxylase